MKKKVILLVLLISTLTLAGCGAEGTEKESIKAETSEVSSVAETIETEASEVPSVAETIETKTTVAEVEKEEETETSDESAAANDELKMFFKKNYASYGSLSNGTWECAGYTYANQFEITGIVPGTSVEATFVYLSNLDEITFEQAWKASGLSDDPNDSFDLNDAVFVYGKIVE